MAPKTDPQNDIDALLERYWLNEAERTEVGAVDAWLAQRPQLRGLVGQLHQGIRAGRWMNLTRAEEDVRVARIIEAIRTPADQAMGHAVDRSRSQAQNSLSREGRFSGVRRWMFGAASAAAVVLVLLISNTGEHRWGNESRSSERGSVYTASNGERAMVHLPDGSTIMLNVGTRLEVSPKFSTGNREVFLDGEASFTVEHKEDAPFQVRTSSSTVRVLGTSFVVSQYPGSHETLVAVRDGKVAVGQTVVAARQQLIVGSAGEERFSEFDPGVFSFEQGALTLRRSSLKDAVGKLNRWYNADIRFGDRGVENLLISGKLAAGSPSDLVEYLKLMYGIRADRNGRVITLYSGGETQ